MRPIKLTLSAFGPYANKQVIDFEELNGRNIFVISGKTGAGKTTIFDAISYALYGEASGESRENDSLRSHFADDDIETYVELEFELRGKTYTVNRVPKQKKKKARGEGYTEKGAEATLTLPDGKVITKVKPVTDKLIELLGITKEQFKQIVMLPQGEFKKLLLADSLERESIFRKIFNTYDFERIQSELKEKALNLTKKRSKSKDKIKTHLEGIKGEHDITINEYIDFEVIINKLKYLIENNNKDYDTLESEVKTIDNNIKVKTSEKINLENNNNLLKEQETIIKDLEILLSKQEEFENKKLNISKAKNAKEVKYIEDKYNDNLKKLETRKEDYSNSLKNIEKLKEDYNKSEQNLKLEEANEDFREKLTIEIDNLKNIQPKIIELDTLNNTINTLNLKCKEIEVSKAKTKEIDETLKKEKTISENSLLEIASLETKKVELENDITTKTNILNDTRELLKIIKAFEKASYTHATLSKEYMEFEKEYKTIKDRYETMDDLYKKEQAGILASSLKENTPCPVCGSVVHPSPATIKHGVNIPTQEELKLEKEKVDKLEKENTEKLNDLTKLKADINNYLQFINTNLGRFAATLNIDSNYTKNTTNNITSKGIELKTLLDNKQKELEKLIEQINLKDTISDKVKELELSINENEKSISKLEEDEKNILKELAQTTTKLEEYKKDIPSNISNINELNNLLDIKTNELNISKQKLNALREEKELLTKNLEREMSASNEINKSIEELTIDTTKNKKQFEDELNKYSFNDISIYEDAKLLIEDIEYLQKEVEDFTSNLNLLNSKKEDINSKTKDLVFVDITSINEELQNLENSKKELEQKVKESYSILEANKTILKNIKNLNTEFKEIEDEYRVIGELADLANGKKSPYISFERYILASYFEDIIEAANIRLEKMTGDRFSLIRKTTKSKGAGQKGLELEIYDNYTDSSRDVSSLSGGESFKASLSLALGLSDVVQSSAGGVCLDTMFVDEGFGTLDPQSLDNAIDSLLELQRGGRLVGIISHVEELKERIDAKLEVTSTSKGSTAKFNIL